MSPTSRTRRLNARPFRLATAILTLAACPALAQQDALLQRIDALIGAAPCHDDGQCRVIGVGARSCGGPESYRAWSTLVTDERALVAATEAHAAARREADRKMGVLSTCEILPEPAVACVRGTCTVQQATPRGTGRNLR